MPIIPGLTVVKQYFNVALIIIFLGLCTSTYVLYNANVQLKVDLQLEQDKTRRSQDIIKMMTGEEKLSDEVTAFINNEVTLFDNSYNTIKLSMQNKYEAYLRATGQYQDCEIPKPGVPHVPKPKPPGATANAAATFKREIIECSWKIYKLGKEEAGGCP